MAGYSISSTPLIDGIPYAVSVPLTSTEADLNGGTNVPTSPIPVEAGQAISAVIKLTIIGYIAGNSTYVVMQMDMGDDTWVDINWCFWDGRQGTAIFVFSNGIAGANSFQQSRNTNQVPVNSSGVQGNGSNQLTLSGRIRFVGRTSMTGGSSSVSGTATSISATIRYKLLHLK